LIRMTIPLVRKQARYIGEVYREKSIRETCESNRPDSHMAIDWQRLDHPEQFLGRRMGYSRRPHKSCFESVRDYFLLREFISLTERVGANSQGSLDPGYDAIFVPTSLAEGIFAEVPEAVRDLSDRSRWVSAMFTPLSPSPRSD
jgi:hypothetical protein